MVTVGQPLVFAVGILGNILSFLVTLAPLPTFYRVYRKKSTESFQSVPYVVALLSAMLWLYYALLTKDVLLLSINAIACVVQSVYITIYNVYAPKEAMAFTVKLMCTMNVALYGGMVAFLQFYVEGHRRVAVAGGIGAAFAFAVFVAPLAIIRQVIRTKSVEFMPFWLSFFLTLSAVVWFLYGLLMKDFFVAMPNVLGLLFGLAQMALYIMYRNPKKSGAVSEIQVAQQQQEVADEVSKDQQQLHTHHNVADGEVAIICDVAADNDGADKNDDDVAVDILPPSTPPPEKAPPSLPAPAVPTVTQMAIEVV